MTEHADEIDEVAKWGRLANERGRENALLRAENGRLRAENGRLRAVLAEFPTVPGSPQEARVQAALSGSREGSDVE